MIEDVPGYRVLEKVGEGGFSVVYRAYQERLDRQVALKVLSVGAVGAVALRRFQRECRITGRLTGHPNVVTVLETGTTGSGRPYVAMEYFEHGSLTDLLRREGPLPVPEVLRIGVKIAGALAATHENGVLHRDVKPQNILLSRYGEPALTDFGVALLVDSSGQVRPPVHAQAFTPHHAAPEVLEGGPPDVRSEVYSLGSTLYQLLAGLPAFQGPPGEDLARFTHRVRHDPPPPIRRDDVPAPVLEVIGTAMAKAPEHRFPSAVAFARRLQRLQGELGLPVTDLAQGVQEVTRISPAPAEEPPAPPPAPVLPPWEVEQPPLRHSEEPAAPPSSGTATGAQPAQNPQPTARDQDAQPAAERDEKARTPQAKARPPASSPDEERPSRKVAVGTVILVGGMVGGIVAAGVFAGDDPSPQAGTATIAPSGGTPSASARTNPAAPVTRAQLLAAAPRRVRLVADRQTSVSLRWWLPQTSRRLPIVVLHAPRDGRRALSAGRGATGVTVGRLRPDARYCFRVGALLRTASANGGKALVAWSTPLCIRTVRS